MNSHFIAVAVLSAAVTPTARSHAEVVRRQTPLRDGWLVKQLDSERPEPVTAGDDAWLSARMPAQAHDVLLAHGRIADPHIGANAAACAWVGGKYWAYVCRFPTPALGDGPALLRFEGLDTLVDVYLNDAALGRFNNMFREYTVPVGDRLAPPGQTNTLYLVFAPPLQFRNECKRKCHADFSSYLGARPHAVKVGVYRDVVLDLPGWAWLDDICVRTELAPDFRAATVRVQVTIVGANATAHWSVTGPTGKPVCSGEGADAAIAIPEPQLWWPRTHGTPNLYHLEVSLRDGDQVLDSRRVAFGIRDVKPVLTDPRTGEKRFRFDINGQPVFLRGADWVPVEGATHVWQGERARRLLDLVEHGQMNILRVWGEGELPPESFYDECDRRGILIWQDFMFGFYDHRPDDTAFTENCRAEVEGIIRRLRNHPALLLWVGGNEQYLRTPTGQAPPAKRDIFEQLLPDACRWLDPTRLFHTSSPYGGSPTGNWPLEGDWHDYTTVNFAPHAAAPLYASEVLRASPPSLSSMRRFLTDAELWPTGFDPAVRKPGQPAWPPAWSYHSTGVGTWDRVGAIQNYCDPANAADLIRLLGTAHGEYLQERVERERRGVSDGEPDGNRRCWGNTVWRLNDAWPMIYSSVVDYYIEPKIAFYFLRRAYDPVLVSFERTPDKICVWVINDSPQPVAGTLLAQRRGFDGRALGQLQAEVALKPGESRRCLDLTDLGEISLRSQFLHATYAGHEATCLLIGERYLHLPEAHLTVRREGDQIEITTDVFARQITLEFPGVTGAVFEDNFFDLAPGQRRQLAIVNAAGGRQLTVHALNASSMTINP